MKVMNTVDYLNATEKKAPATSNDMFALLMQMASLSPRPIAKCDDGFSLSIQASSAHHCEKGENGRLQVWSNSVVFLLRKKASLSTKTGTILRRMATCLLRLSMLSSQNTAG